MGTVPVKYGNGEGGARHLLRFLKSEAGMGAGQIAKSEGVSRETVENSIRMIERYRAVNSTIQMDYAVRDLIVSMMPKAKRTLAGLLEATELVKKEDPKRGTFKYVLREDKTARLDGLKLMADLIGKMQPKAPVAEVNVTTSTQVANLSTAETPEERFRRLRKQQEQFNALPAVIAAVPASIDRGLADEEDEVEGEEEGSEEEEPEEEGPEKGA